MSMCMKVLLYVFICLSLGPLVLSVYIVSISPRLYNRFLITSYNSYYIFANYESAQLMKIKKSC